MITVLKKINTGTYNEFGDFVNRHRSKFNISKDPNKRYLFIVHNEDGESRKIGDEYAGKLPLILGQIQGESYFGMKKPRLRDSNAHILDPNQFESYISKSINGYFGRMFSPERIHPVIVFKAGDNGGIRWDRLHLLDGEILGLFSEKQYFRVISKRNFKSRSWSFSFLELERR
ncbi:hypothetical protein [Leptospira jelokensis]|uniref:Uncharacterized protein n=1 Tax=Leptospira jelokensis TaxID=2484931 RepID=A0A4Z1ACC5_9LEPT|nr:hypothetical protein [Leptospira jelokensis]TGL76896.1 hypothetical protein EHQ62_00390 [Leptospira jelokensis]